MFTGGAGNDSFSASGTTLTTNDTLVGGAGTDSLTISDITAASAAGVPEGVSVTGIETVTVASNGSVGKAAVPAATAVTTAVAQINKLEYTSSTSGATLKVTIGGREYSGTVGSTDTTGAAAAAAAATLIDAALGSITSVATTTKSIITITSPVAGKPLPSISGSTVDTANATLTASSIALKEVMKFTPTYSADGAVTVYVDGVAYSAGASGASAELTGAAIANILNQVIGAATAVNTASTGVVTLTAPVAGVGLPLIRVAVAGGSSVAAAQAVPNQSALTAAVVAVPYSVSGFTDLTTFNSTSVGGANIAAAGTTNVTETNTGSGVVKTSGGLAVTVKSNDSVEVLAAKGAVDVTLSAVPTSKFSESASTSTGANPAWTATAGVLVTGGTTVSVTNTKGATVTSGSSTVTSQNTTPIIVGASTANITTNTTTGVETQSNLGANPTGNVVTNVSSKWTDAAGLSDIAYGGGAVTVTTNGGDTVSVTGAGAVTIKDIKTTKLVPGTGLTSVAGTSKLATVNLTGVSGATSITSDAISTVSIVDSSSTVTVSGNTGANTGAINVSVGNSTTTVVNATATSVAVNGVGSSSAAVNGTKVATGAPSTVTLTAAKATGVSFAGSSDITLASSTLTVATAITASGSGKLDLGTPTGYAKVTSFDGSAATGAVTASLGETIGSDAATARGFAFTSGSGNDSVTLTGAMKSGTSAAGAVIQNTINLGAGNDKLLSSSGSIAAGASVNGGDGTDTIAASLLTVGNAAQITNFEVLGLDKTSGDYDTDLLVGATGLSGLALTSGTYTNVNTTQGMTYAKDLGSSSGTIKLTFGTAETTGTADAYAVTFAGTALSTGTLLSPTPIRAQTLEIPGIEAISVASGGTGFVSNSIILNGANARSVTLSGDKPLDVSYASAFGGSTAVSSTNGLGVTAIDGSAATGKLTLATANVLKAYAGLTVKGGSADDSITVAGAMTVDAGAGDDLITISASGAAGNGATLTGGAGKDTFDVILGTAYDVTNDASLYITTINDFSAGDTLKIVASTSSSAAYVNGTSLVSAANPSTLKGALDAALLGSTVVTGATVWFSYGGNTYVVNEQGTDGLTTDDVIVKLVGAHKLSADAVTTTTPATGLFGEA